MPKLQQQILSTNRKYSMLSPGGRVGVAVSGGGDSVALLRLLLEMRDRLGITLLVLHFNHLLRGAESAADEQFVEQLARAHDLELHVAREDVASHARTHRWNLEDAGRRLRYDFFADVIARGAATRIAVAHTLDDQAETVLARLLRGAGNTGLAGIYPVAGHIVRPLLEVRREQLRAYLAQCGQSWREDPTNRDATRLRSRLRHQLLPELEREFAPGTTQRLAEFAGHAHADELFWNALVEARLPQITTSSASGVAVSISQLAAPLELPAAAQRAAESAATNSQLARDPAVTAAPSAAWQRPLAHRLIRRIFQQLAGQSGQLSARHVEQVMRLALQGASGRRIELPGGVIAEKVFDRMLFSSPAGAHAPARATPNPAQLQQPLPQPPSSAAWEYPLSLAGRHSATVLVPELRRRYSLKVIDWPQPSSDTRGDGDALDIERLRDPLVLRSWRPGDAYRPAGHRHSQKVKRMFLASRIPSRNRAGWPVLTSAGEIVWVRGMPVAESFLPGASTRKGVVIVEYQEGT
jgi:tRNA(Ile)-lysidine synthase